jgi:hypothetical protein
MGKARVAPKKPITIPRLELTAATVSVKVSTLLNSELEMDGIVNFYWTDSKIVLGYINNDVRRFKIFVANRVQFIREATQPEDWRYVDTKNNPADDASRGLDASHASNDHRWFQGPDFLWKSFECWPEVASLSNELANDDVELKRVITTVVTNLKETSFVLKLAARVSDWYRLKKLLIIIIR